MSRRRICVFALGLALIFATGASAQLGQGKVLIEYWFGGNINDNLDNLKANPDFPNNPAYGELLDAVELPDFANVDYFGAMLRAYVTPPQTGDYTFWTASDDDSEVWLSTDDNPANAKLICSVEGWTGWRNYAGTEGAPGANQKSAAITLEAGKRYYIEALISDGTGGGHVSVAWAGPGIGDAPTPIGSAYVTAFASESPFLARSPNPASGAADILAPLFRWTAGLDAFMDDVYFGTNPNPGPAEFKSKQPSPVSLFVYPVLEAGATYYWRVDTADIRGALHTGKVWSFTVMPAKATAPSPADGATFVVAKPTLTWRAGQNVPTHDVYLGTDKDAVAAGDAGVLKASALADASFEVAEALAFETKYYWRVDEIDATGAKFVGDVWSFTTTLEVLGKIKREIYESIGSSTAVSALLSASKYPMSPNRSDFVTSFKSPDLGISNYGGSMAAFLHVPTAGDYTFWVASDDDSQLFFGATPSDAKVIASVAGWTNVEEWGKFASQKSAVQTLQEGVYFIQALWKEGGGGDHCEVAWQGPGIPRQVIPGGYCEPFIAYWARKPSPANGATGVAQAPTLSWAPGVKAAQQDIYFGDNAAAVAAADATSPLYKGRVGLDVLTLAPGDLTWNKTYYWRVDEVNDVAAGSPWVGAVWSFTTANYLIIDMAQKTLGYDNFNSPFFSEQVYTTPADWTVNGISDLALEFQGIAPPPATKGSTTIDGPGAYTLVGAGSDIWGTADQFQLAYMQLTGDGSITAKVESVENKNVWAKGGVMIRQSAAPNSAYALMCATGGGAGTGGGVNFQWRASASASAAGGPNGPGVATPYWVRLTRVGNVITAFSSPDGATWTQLGDPQTIVMTDPVLMGLAYTSHVNNTTFGTGKFTNVVPTGNIDPATANNLDIGYGNTPQPIYVAVEDAAGKVAIATYPEPEASRIISWTSWKVPLSDLAGVDLKNMAKLYVGVGDSLNPKPDGVGRIFIRNVRVVKPVSLPAAITSVVRANGQSGNRTDGSPINGAYVADTTPVATQAGGLKDGNFCFSDRNYPWAKTPAELVGSEYILTFNNDKATGEKDVTYTVTIGRTSTVWITVDDRIPAEWTAAGAPASAQAAADYVTAAFAAPGTFVDTGLDLFVHESATTDRQMSVYAAELPAGTYVFDSMWSNKNFYTIGAIGGPVDITNPEDNVLGLPANSNWPAGEHPRLAIDNNSGTKFLHFSGATEATGIQVQPFVGSTIVTGLTFRTANDAPERTPVKFELSGSNDGIKGPWTLITAGDIVDFAGATAWPIYTINATPIAFENGVGYKFYQVMFPACRGPNQNSMQISEVELIGVLAK